jgi:hypothetical protein
MIALTPPLLACRLAWPCPHCCIIHRSVHFPSCETWCLRARRAGGCHGVRAMHSDSCHNMGGCSHLYLLAWRFHLLSTYIVTYTSASASGRRARVRVLTSTTPAGACWPSRAAAARAEAAPAHVSIVRGDADSGHGAARRRSARSGADAAPPARVTCVLAAYISACRRAIGRPHPLLSALPWYALQRARRPGLTRARYRRSPCKNTRPTGSPTSRAAPRSTCPAPTAAPSPAGPPTAARTSACVRIHDRSRAR